MSFVIWMTGLPCSGKTTIAKKLCEHIPNLAILDGDVLREWLSPKDFSRSGRNEHNIRVAHLAKLLVQHKVPVCVSLISPYLENRSSARQIIGENKFIETYVKCSLGTCENRDVKGMYAKARKKEISNFTGIDDNYDVPQHPQLTVDSEFSGIDKSVKQILDYLKSNDYIK